MKRKNPRPHKPAKVPPDPRRLFAQPEQDFYRLPELELRGGVLMTDGCRKILDFTPEKITLDMGRFVLIFYGRNLRIESLAGKRLLLAGKVERIDIQNKWEGQDGSL